MPENVFILREITNLDAANIISYYKPKVGFSGYVTTLKLKIDINSITAANFPYIPDDTPPDVLEKILEEVAINTLFKEIKLYFRKGAGAWIERASLRTFNKEPYYDVSLIRFFSDANTIDVAEDCELGIQVAPGSGNVLTATDRITIWGSSVEEKKNNGNEELAARIEALELALYGRLTNLGANSLLGRNVNTGTVEVLPQDQFVNTSLKQSISGSKAFLSPIQIPYFEKDIYLKISSGINWAANTWYSVPGMTIAYEIGTVRCYLFTFNLQYTDGAAQPITYTHWQIGGGGILSGGIGWKAGFSRAEQAFVLEAHYSVPQNMKIRTTYGITRGVEVNFDFPIILSNTGFMEFFLKRML